MYTIYIYIYYMILHASTVSQAPWHVDQRRDRHASHRGRLAAPSAIPGSLDFLKQWYMGIDDSFGGKGHVIRIYKVYTAY